MRLKGKKRFGVDELQEKQDEALDMMTKDDTGNEWEKLVYCLTQKVF